MTVYARIQNQITTVPRYPNGLKIGAYLFPKNDGSSGQALITNGSGTVSWGNAGAQLSGTNTWTETQTFSKRIVLGTTPTEHVLSPGAALEVNSTGSTTNSGNIAASFIANTDDLGNTSNLLRKVLYIKRAGSVGSGFDPSSMGIQSYKYQSSSWIPDTLSINNNGGKVTIGTSAYPSQFFHYSAALDVFGDVYLTTNNGSSGQVGLYFSESTTGSVPSALVSSFGPNFTKLYYTNNFLFNDLNNSSNVPMYINYLGNVGFGTDSPTNLVHISKQSAGKINLLKLSAFSGYQSFAAATISSVNTTTKTFQITVTSTETYSIAAMVPGTYVYGTAGTGSFGSLSTTQVTVVSAVENWVDPPGVMRVTINVSYSGTPASNPTNGTIVSVVLNGFVKDWGPQLLFSGMGDARDMGTIFCGTELDNSGANSYISLSTRKSEVITEQFRITSSGNIGAGTNSPNSTFHVNGSVAFNASSISANTTLDGTYTHVFASGTITITLPTAVGIAGRTYWIKRTGTGTITINTTSSQTIDGASSLSITAQYDSYTLVSDGSNWFIV